MTKHSQSDQNLLDSMTEQEKLDRTTPESFAERGSLVYNREAYYVTKNEMPDENAYEHITLWVKYRHGKEAKGYIYKELDRYTLLGYTVYRNPPKASSVRRPHWHIVKYK